MKYPVSVGFVIIGKNFYSTHSEREVLVSDTRKAVVEIMEPRIQGNRTVCIASCRIPIEVVNIPAQIVLIGNRRGNCPTNRDHKNLSIPGK